MFLHLTVILFTEEGVYPSMQWGVHPPGHTILGRHIIPIWADTLTGETPQAHNLLKTATEEGGVHPTGMHSCLITCLIIIIIHSYFGRCLLFTVKHLGRICNLTKDIRVSGDHNRFILPIGMFTLSLQSIHNIVPLSTN